MGLTPSPGTLSVSNLQMVFTQFWNTCAACFAPVFCSKSSLVHKIKAIQGSAGTSVRWAQRVLHHFLQMDSEQHSNNSNQTVTMESLGWALSWLSLHCCLPALSSFAMLLPGTKPPLVSITLQPSSLFFAASAPRFQHEAAGKFQLTSCSFINSSTKIPVVP